MQGEFEVSNFERPYTWHTAGLTLTNIWNGAPVFPFKIPFCYLRFCIIYHITSPMNRCSTCCRDALIRLSELFRSHLFWLAVTVNSARCRASTARSSTPCLYFHVSEPWRQQHHTPPAGCWFCVAVADSSSRLPHSNKSLLRFQHHF